MLLTFASYAACFVIPLFVGAVALIPFRYHFYLSVFVHWLIFSLLVIYIVIGSFNHYDVTISLIGGIGGIIIGMVMVIPSLFINLWATLCLLESLNREKDDLGYLILYPAFFVMGYSACMFGMYILRYLPFLDAGWPGLIFLCLLTVSPALVAILIRLTNRKLI
jgi:hypothetical protein